MNSTSQVVGRRWKVLHILAARKSVSIYLFCKELDSGFELRVLNNHPDIKEFLQLKRNTYIELKSAGERPAEMPNLPLSDYLRIKAVA